jgi:hypothetical protein
VVPEHRSFVAKLHRDVSVIKLHIDLLHYDILKISFETQLNQKNNLVELII